ncbi:MAG: hypothetical protein VXW65_03600 [Pseudomonadota bacterium]|nr:hypothetical protein [Pseudomonadota bacterium]
MILALKSHWQQPINISRRSDARQLGLVLPIGVMSRDPNPKPRAQSEVVGLPAALSELSATDAAQQVAIGQKLDASAYSVLFLGLFTSIAQLETAHPTANAGQYAQVDWGIGTDVIIYAWDASDNRWSAIGSSSIANTDQLPEGIFNFYFTTARVRQTTLDGLSTSDGTPVVSTDLLLAAIGKLQAQINNQYPKMLINESTPVDLIAESTRLDALPAIYELDLVDDGDYQLLINYKMSKRSASANISPIIEIDGVVLSAPDYQSTTVSTAYNQASVVHFVIDISKHGTSLIVFLRKDAYRIASAAIAPPEAIIIDTTIVSGATKTFTLFDIATSATSTVTEFRRLSAQLIRVA